MDENIKYELAEAEKLEVIDNAGVAEKMCIRDRVR